MPVLPSPIPQTNAASLAFGTFVLCSWFVGNTNQRKLSIAVLALAGGALLVDKFFLGTSAPEVARADEAPAQIITQSPASASAAPQLTVAKRLERLAPHGGTINNAFAVPASWRTVAAPTAQGPNIDTPAAAFVKEHHVAGLMRGGTDPARAMVNGKLISIGDSIDGGVLVEVNEVGAVFDVGGVRVQIALRPETKARDGVVRRAGRDDGDGSAAQPSK